MTVLVVGKGSLGTTLVEKLNKKVSAGDSAISEVLSVGHSDLDISDKVAVDNFFHGLKEVDVVVNCAAFTDTKAAESDGYDRSFLANVVGARNLQWQCLLNDAHLIHISTDYVYSENSASAETEISENGVLIFGPNDREFPVNAYGCHKLLGEKSLNPKYSTTLRVGWLYGDNSNGKSFVDKILSSVESVKNGRSSSIRVVNDVFGIPTSTEFVSDAVIELIENDQMELGVVNLVPRGLPPSRASFAQMIVCGAGFDIDIESCKSSEFKSCVRYPLNTSMKNTFPHHIFPDKNGLGSRIWQADLFHHLERRFSKDD